jgi:hypothetical protein
MIRLLGARERSSRSARAHTASLAWVLLAAMLPAIGCTTSQSGADLADAPGPTTQGSSPATSQTVAAVDDLVVAPESQDETYDRELFGSGWIDADGDGCDTREEVLITESITPAQVDPYGCQVVAGDWRSIYDGEETADPSDFDIDHVVALGEAWRSGASSWTPDQRLAFANHLDDPAALIAVTASTNRSKGDRDPASWQPPDRDAWCEFATAWTTVKVQWGLTADQAEVDALRNMLVGC